MRVLAAQEVSKLDKMIMGAEGRGGRKGALGS